MKAFSFLQRKKDIWFLLFVSFFFFLLRLPSLFEPYWYGDEGIYEVIGLALSKGRFLYTGIWDNKPPLLYLIYALFQGDQSAVRLLSLVVGLLSVIGIFFLAKKLLTSQKAVYLVTALFAFLFGIPLVEGNIANAENFMLLPAIIAGYIIFSLEGRITKQKSSAYMLLCLAGLLLGTSFLIKVVAIFDFAAFFVFLFILNTKKLKIYELLSQIPKLVSLGIGFFLPLFVTTSIFFLHGQVKTFITSAFLSNVGYVNYGNQFVIPQGLLIVKLILLFGILIFLFIKRAKLPSAMLFIFLWLAFSIFNALFAQRPYTHYMLVLLPSFSLFVGLLIANKKLRLPLSIVLLLLLGLLIKSFYFYSHPITYYQNFVSFLVNQKNVDAYYSFFDSNVPRDYTIASYISSHLKKGQSIFIWGNSGQVYKLTDTLPPGRFIVAYHIVWTQANKTETTNALIANPPQFIVIYPQQDALIYSLKSYKERVIIDGATIYEKIF